MDKRKRLQYVLEINPDFIATNIIAYMYSLKLFNETKRLKYPQKLASLILFINSEDNVNLFSSKTIENYHLKLEDYEKLSSIHVKSKLIEPHLNRVLNVLEKNKFIVSYLEDDTLCIYLNKDKCSFINQPMYSELLINTMAIKKSYSYISSVKFSTYFSKIFKEASSIESNIY